MDAVVALTLIAVAGIGSQWLAWRWQMPAIVFMLLAGLIVGPIAGWLFPGQVFGELLSPFISVAVALILFEGGMTLDLRGLRDAGVAVKRLVLFGGPLVWFFATLAAHFIGKMTWESSLVIGGIVVVTGPTVVTPLLRQAALKSRTAEVLRWEAIVNDPIGALFAVLAFEIAIISHENIGIGTVIWHLVMGSVFAIALGYILGRLLAWAFKHGYVPEFLKVPVLLVFVFISYTAADHVLHESGLLAVTILGLVIGNSGLPSLGDLRQFNENLTVILVSGVFIVLAALLNTEMLSKIGLSHILFVLALIFLVRPIAVLISLIRSNLTMNERVFIGWIGPRGVVAFATAGLFGIQLSNAGIVDGDVLAPLAFLIVAFTVVLHGFSIKPLAQALGLTSTKSKGVLIVGGSKGAEDLAKALTAQERPVLISDRNWSLLRGARQQNIEVYYGEILSETAEYTIDMNKYSHILALTDNDDYNTLICTDFAPHYGRNYVFQLKPATHENEGKKMPETIGGRIFGQGLSYQDFEKKIREGARVQSTRLSEAFTLAHYQEQNPESLILAIVPEKGDINILKRDSKLTANAGDVVLAMAPKKLETAKAKA